MTTQSDSASLTILHTNDMHNRLPAGKAARIAALRVEHSPAVVLLDAGDAAGAGNVTYHAEGEPILRVMSEAGYDVMTVGNRDFHFSEHGFKCKLKLAQFPVLSANIRGNRGPDQKLPVLKHILLERAGWRVAIFGVTVPMITERMMSRHASAYLFDSPIKIAVDQVREIRSQYTPDLVIALTHIGLTHDRKLAAEVPGIDLIVGGHSHNTLPEGERVGPTLIVQTGSWAHAIGRVTATRAPSGSIDLAAELLPL
jgi:2',3'-cyclic-nucleotide 2'-phosphodiesterase (5'-nucleotidase family)